MRDARRERRSAFTLVELLLVISLIALILGIGIGVFARIDLGDRVAVALVQDALRSAHNFAVARSAPARVRFDKKTGGVRAEGMLVIGTWHFEGEPIRGAFGVEGAMLGGQIVDDGFQGRALSFVGEPSRSRVQFPIEKDSAWNLREGVALRCALRPAAIEREAGAGSVLAIGDSFGLDTGSDGTVRAWITAEVQDADQVPRKGGKISVESLPSALIPGRWSVVEVQYDRRRLRLLVDGALAAELAETAPVWKIDGPLVLSPANAPWQGTIDSLSFGAVVARDESQLPSGVVFAAGTPDEIRFAPGGALDGSVHPEPVRMALEFEDGRRESVLVNLYGTVE